MARSGNTCPGRTKSSDTAVGFAKARNVRARSNADVPVVVPRFASTDSVNGVPNLDVLSETRSLSPRRSAISGAIGAHRDAAAIA
jgi:hypothetical protein